MPERTAGKPESWTPAPRVRDILASLQKPLHFASKDSFAHLNSVKGMEHLSSLLCGELLSMGLPDMISGRVRSLSELLCGFDSLGFEAKKERVSSALEIIEIICAPQTEKNSFILPEQEIRKRLQALKTPLEFVKGIGPKLAERFDKKGLKTVEDLLYFLPIRYEDRKGMKKIRDLVPGPAQSVAGEVLASGEARYGKRKVFEMAVGDGTGILKVKWFHYKLSYMKNRYKNGQRLSLFGNVTVFGSQKEMIHPDIEIFSGDDDGGGGAGDERGITPVYSQIENFHQKTIRKIIKNVVDSYAPHALPGVPEDVSARCALMDVPSAFKEAHFPADSVETARLARKSLVFDELFLLELGMALKRREVKKEAGIRMAPAGALEKKLRGLLPFKLTGAQERTLIEIKKDMAAPHPMNRLIQGDVGSGKTVVSMIAALTAIEAGCQAAIMAPTEILAEQHHISIKRYADEAGIRAALLTGSLSAAERKHALQEIASGEAKIIIGTHALIQKGVEFRKLGLAVIDEQHRFGVVQRAALKRKGEAGEVIPDILIMTATPIPRTLSMTVFGDLDVSIMDELPPGRQPIVTRVIREKDRERAYDAIKRELSSGSQCYIVYPLVEESEELSLKDATNMAAHLQADIFTDFRIGLLHGRMKQAEKESVMRDFKEKRLDILVSTTVIEVGVDVPNATVMLIEHAERFGLAQLHQLRGRVGRGTKKSICLLLAAWTNSEDTYRRLKVMENTMDGFKIAEEDLNIRGPGDFLGTRQAGLPDFRLTEALSDLSILKKAREEAFRLLERSPEAAGSVYLREILKSRWEGRFELAEIG